MSKKEYLIRYLLIIKRLRNSKKASFSEINQYLQDEFSILDAPKNISLRTFQRDLNEIRTIFNIDIKCNSQNQYYISEDDESGFNKRMMEAFDVFNSFTIGQKLQPYLLFERRCSIGTEHLYGLLHAIKNRYLVRFIYQKYFDEIQTLREVEPYALKEFKGRWYLLSKDYKDNNIKTFALDRIRELEISKSKFLFPENIVPLEYFTNCFGVTNSSKSELEEIILSFDPLQGKYIKSYPLHESQKVLMDNDEQLQISLEVFQTHDFIMELLSFGEDVRVIKPERLIKRMKEMIKKMDQIYSDNFK
jgi:predicted DNA-binding transcriptional regulator YafY